MTYGVVVCKRCRRAKAYEVGQRTTTCPTCGARLQVESLRTFYESDDEAAVREAIGRINARLAGEPEVMEGVLEGTLESFGDEAAPRVLPKGRPRDVEEVARELAGERGVFSETAFREALDSAGLDGAEADHHLARLVEMNVLYEPRPGRFRVLD